MKSSLVEYRWYALPLVQVHPAAAVEALAVDPCPQGRSGARDSKRTSECAGPNPGTSGNRRCPCLSELPDCRELCPVQAIGRKGDRRSVPLSFFDFSHGLVALLRIGFCLSLNTLKYLDLL